LTLVGVEQLDYPSTSSIVGMLVSPLTINNKAEDHNEKESDPVKGEYFAEALLCFRGDS
jgi:hypothetical protein